MPWMCKLLFGRVILSILSILLLAASSYVSKSVHHLNSYNCEPTDMLGGAATL